MKFSIIVLLILSAAAVSIRDDPAGKAPAVVEPKKEHERAGYPNIDSDGGYVIKSGSL